MWITSPRPHELRKKTVDNSVDNVWITFELSTLSTIQNLEQKLSTILPKLSTKLSTKKRQLFTKK